MNEPEEQPNVVDVTDADLAAAGAYSMVIAWSPEDDAYVVSVPELPGVHTHGDTPEVAEAMGDEVIALVLAAYRDLGRQVPPPDSERRRLVIGPVQPVGGDRIRSLRHRLHLSQSELASALNVSPSAVDAWERQQDVPDGASARFLDLVERDPTLFTSLFRRSDEDERRTA